MDLAHTVENDAQPNVQPDASKATAFFAGVGAGAPVNFALGSMKRHMTLTQLERDDWGPPPYDSFLVTECHRLRHVPLRDLTVENLRLLIGQSISLPFTVPLALEHLSKDPMVSGDMYPGDLLKAVHGIKDDFWAQHPSLMTAWQRVKSHAS